MVHIALNETINFYFVNEILCDSIITEKSLEDSQEFAKCEGTMKTNRYICIMCNTVILVLLGNIDKKGGQYLTTFSSLECKLLI